MWSLTRTRVDDTGCYGTLSDGSTTYFTIEHAYPQDLGTYAPKLPAGTYTCKRGLHILEGMSHNFVAFEVLGVPNASGILIHVGNSQVDSSGCVLIGLRAQANLILDSRLAFSQFMEGLCKVNTFQLSVS